MAAVASPAQAATDTANATKARTPPLSASEKAGIRCQEKVIMDTGTISTAGMRKCWIAQVDKAMKRLDREYADFMRSRVGRPLLTITNSSKRKTMLSAQEAW